MAYYIFIEQVTIISVMRNKVLFHNKKEQGGYKMSNNKKNHNNKNQGKQKSSSHPKHKTSSSANGHNGYH